MRESSACTMSAFTALLVSAVSAASFDLRALRSSTTRSVSRSKSISAGKSASESKFSIPNPTHIASTNVPARSIVSARTHAVPLVESCSNTTREPSLRHRKAHRTSLLSSLTAFAASHRKVSSSQRATSTLPAAAANETDPAGMSSRVTWSTRRGTQPQNFGMRNSRSKTWYVGLAPLAATSTCTATSHASSPGGRIGTRASRRAFFSSKRKYRDSSGPSNAPAPRKTTPLTTVSLFVLRTSCPCPSEASISKELVTAVSGGMSPASAVPPPSPFSARRSAAEDFS
mmetsp:Transcript_8809/g.37242  ORF Transcript_8809/g.37242 Transcript_8809/m.37242 type:complete len:286 (-) Transcript_8809:1482-2339(-)